MAQQVVELAQSVTVSVTEEEGFHSSLELFSISIVLLPLAKHHYITMFFIVCHNFN